MEFILRPWRMEDADSAAAYANDEELAGNLRDAFPFPYTRADAEAYITACIQADKAQQYCCAIECGGKAVGSIGFFLQQDVARKSAEIGYWLGRPFWGQGVMTAAVKQLCGIAFEQYRLARLYAEPFARNLGSQRVLEKAGFHLEGVLRSSVFKRGVLQDSCLYARLAAD